jgi:hypothetical protein
MLWFLPKFIACTLPSSPRISLFSIECEILFQAALARRTALLQAVDAAKLFVFLGLAGPPTIAMKSLHNPIFKPQCDPNLSKRLPNFFRCPTPEFVPILADAADLSAQFRKS